MIPATRLHQNHKMTVTLKGNKLVIEIDADTTASRLSSTGKTKIVASSGGNQSTTVLVAGKPVIVGLNAYIKV